MINVRFGEKTHANIAIRTAKSQHTISRDVTDTDGVRFIKFMIKLVYKYYKMRLLNFRLTRLA